MRSLLILFSFILVVNICARDILDEEESRDLQRYCEKYASCRKSARQQFEKCSGGFGKMIMAQTDSLRIKPSSKAAKCEKELLNSIETEIQPIYESIESDTFECAKSADPNAFNLDQSQTLICKAIQQEIGLDNFAINGAESSSECRNTFESQMQRCDLVKECCPQFTHCHTKAEIENNVYGKEEKLAKKLDACIGSSSGKSGEYKHEEVRKSEASTTSEPSTTTASTEPPTTASTFPTLPPPNKVLNDLVKALFPGLEPPTEAPAVVDNDIRKKESSHRKFQGIASLSEIAQWKSSHQKLKQIKAKDGHSSNEVEALLPAKPAALQEAPTSQPPLTLRHRSRIHAAPIISKDAISYSDQQKQSLSRVYCDQLIECEAVVEKQFKLCDSRHQPSEALFGIEKQSLRKEFLKNSNVTDAKVKHRCLEAVDPESQRQLSMLDSIVSEQNQKCTRKAAIPSITSDKFDDCQNIRLITVISELFTQKDIPEGRSTESAEKCYSRVLQLQTQCSILQTCCPQHSECTFANHSTENSKYFEIIEQLKEEQTLCEKRRMRILNGLV